MTRGAYERRRIQEACGPYRVIETRPGSPSIHPIHPPIGPRRLIAILGAVAASLASAAWGMDAPRSNSTEARTSIREEPTVDIDLEALEPRLHRLIDATGPAVARLTRRNRGITTASGVIFDPEGLVLTAGHVATGRSARFDVELADGRSFPARMVGSIFEGDLDLAVLRMDLDAEGPDGEGRPELPWIPLAPAGSIEARDWVLALGHAAAISPREVGDPAARLGRVLAIDRASLSIDSPIDAGDSGGPIIDLDGRVIGIASRCGSEAWQNLATSIDAIHAWMPHLLDEEVEAPDVESWDGRNGRRSPTGTKRDPQMLADLKGFTERLDGLVVEIRSDDRLVTHATVVGPNRVITKASLLARHAPDPRVVQELDGTRREIAATPIGFDPDLDLVVLEAPGVSPPLIRPRGRTRETPAGTMVLVPDDTGGVTSIGIVARDSDDLPRAESPDDRPFLGVASRPSPRGGLGVTTVVPNSAAALAGLEVGDRLLRLDEVDLDRSADLPDALSRRNFGDAIRLEVAREDRNFSLELRLGLRPEDSRRFVPGNTATGTSRLSSGFGPVHLVDADAPLHAVGGPAIDLDGRLMGWIAARRTRTSLVLVPWERIQSSIESMPIDRDETESRLCSYRVTATEDEDGLRLPAEDASPEGATLRRERRGAGGRTTWGSWTEAGDALTWTAAVDEPGRFLVRLKSACPTRHAGTPVRFRIGDASVDGRIEGTEGWSEFEWQEIGVVTLEETGILDVRFESRARPRRAVCNFERIELVRLEEAGEPGPEDRRTRMPMRD